jgi:putative Mg2+ transporter-C (MgtC) family protein
MEPITSQAILKLVIALVLGVVLGIERVYAHKTAGMRTYGLVAMASALFMVISEAIVLHYGIDFVNPTRIAAAIITGIGFLGAGVIIFKDNHVANLTTAAGLWVAAGIGIAVGFGMYVAGAIATVLTLFVFEGLAFIERRMKTKIKEDI